MKRIYIALFVIALLVIMPGCTDTSDGVKAKTGNTVQVHYTGKLADGTIFDSSSGRDPLKFTIGSGQVIKGFDQAVTGMKVGEKKTVTIPANDAYGPYRKDLTMEVPRTQLPKEIIPAVGMQLESQQPNGSIIVVTITKVTDAAVTVDQNHPLAGKDLTFELELVKIL